MRKQRQPLCGALQRAVVGRYLRDLKLMSRCTCMHQCDVDATTLLCDRIPELFRLLGSVMSLLVPGLGCRRHVDSGIRHDHKKTPMQPGCCDRGSPSHQIDNR